MKKLRIGIPQHACGRSTSIALWYYKNLPFSYLDILHQNIGRETCRWFIRMDIGHI